jgi:adhesin transport system membrane fusion protein
MTATDRDLWVDPAETDREGSRVFAHLLLGAVVLFMVSFIVWASMATLDEVTRGEGRVIPSSKIQVIQNLEGGIVAEILVGDGAVVDQGQVLLRIENTAAEADFGELQQRRLSALAAVARLQAEQSADQAAEPVFPDDLMDMGPEIATAELSLFNVRQQQLRSQIQILEDQVTQRKQEMQELDSKLSGLRSAFGLANEELKITRPLAEQGVVAKVDLLRLEREVLDLKSQIDATALAKPRAESALQEAERRIEERRVTFRSEAATELSKRQLELVSLTQALTADRDRVQRTEVRSPVHGTVKVVKVRTVGGVVQPGQDLVEIVPIEDTLLIEAQVRPSDIAFMYPNQKAVIKISAYDFSIYGGLDAVVEQISADAIEDKEKGESFFRIYLRTDRNYLGTAEDPLPIIPGMTASVDILTGEKTVMEYLMKPILRARNEALRER